MITYKTTLQRWILRALFIIAATSLLASCGSTAKAPTPIPTDNAAKAETESDDAFRIAVIPVQTEGQLGEAIDKLQVLLSDVLGREVTVQDYPDYNGVVEAMNYGHVDMAFFGPLTYVIAHEKSGAEAIVVQLVEGKPNYYSYIITHKDQPWNSLDDLFAEPSQIAFAFGDPNSTSGSLVPGAELKNRGVMTDETHYQLKEVRYTGSHDVTALAVQNKHVDAGAIDSAIYDNLVKKGVIDGNQIKVIWQSEELFQYPWAVRKGTDPELIAQLQDVFVGIQDETILQGFGISGFATTSDADYESIRVVAEQEGRLE